MIKSALTREEWVEICERVSPSWEAVLVAGYDGTPISIETTNQVIASLALAGEAEKVIALSLVVSRIKFTREDVEWLRSASTDVRINLIADRIEALLPPEDL